MMMVIKIVCLVKPSNKLNILLVIFKIVPMESGRRMSNVMTVTKFRGMAVQIV